jgi:hypothetical protein
MFHTPPIDGTREASGRACNLADPIARRTASEITHAARWRRTPSRYSIVVERVVCVVVVMGAPSIGGVGSAAVAVVEVLVCSVVVVAVSGEPPPQPARTRTAALIHVASRMRVAVVLFDRMMSSGSFRGRV